MKEKDNRNCLNCVYFNNSPAYIESVFKGLTALSSGYASVKKDDGICQLRDEYLSSDNKCSSFKSPMRKKRVTS